MVIAPADPRQIKYAHTGIDYLEEMVQEMPLYSGVPPTVHWPDRYFIALRGWNIHEPVTPFDVLLVPFRGDQPKASVDSMECNVVGDPSRPARPRALRVKSNDQELHVFHSIPGVSVSTHEITFSGCTAAIELQDGTPTRAFVHKGDALGIRGTQIPVSGEGSEVFNL